MMNFTKIEWCDFTWNPVTGCTFGCTYCYAARQARRFSGDVRLNLQQGDIKIDRERGVAILDEPFHGLNGQVIPFPAGFMPTIHKYRLGMPAQKKKPARIFVCSMGDLFDDAISDDEIRDVHAACDAAPWHAYLFLTKQPQRYAKLADAGILRSAPNFWYGTTVTKPENEFFWREGLNTFVSIEPIRAEFEAEPAAKAFAHTGWVILGQEHPIIRGRSIVAEPKWIEEIIEAAKRAGTPLFMKDNIAGEWGAELIREYPEALDPKRFEIPACAECEACERVDVSPRRCAYFCKHGNSPRDTANGGGVGPAAIGRPISRNKARPMINTSPDWCPRRRTNGTP